MPSLFDAFVFKKCIDLDQIVNWKLSLWLESLDIWPDTSKKEYDSDDVWIVVVEE